METIFNHQIQENTSELFYEIEYMIAKIVYLIMENIASINTFEDEIDAYLTGFKDNTVLYTENVKTPYHDTNIIQFMVNHMKIVVKPVKLLND